MWDNLILRNRKMIEQNYKNTIIQIFLSFEEESVLSVSKMNV
jgi:hypothetical protein